MAIKNITIPMDELLTEAVLKKTKQDGITFPGLLGYFCTKYLQGELSDMGYQPKRTSDFSEEEVTEILKTSEEIKADIDTKTFDSWDEFLGDLASAQKK